MNNAKTGGSTVGNGNRPANKLNAKPRTAGGKGSGQKPGSRPNGAAGNGGATAKRRPATAREVALDVLIKVEREQAFSNLVLNTALQHAELSRPDAGLATELVYGTIQRKLSLDYALAELASKGLAKLEPWVLQLLRLSAYQILFLDRVPAHAAVNEAVTIAKRRGHAGISGMVNGMLRNLIRRREELSSEAAAGQRGLSPARRIALRHSYPEWLAARWIAAYGEAAAESICAAGNEPPRASIRVNPLRGTRDNAISMLADAGIEAEASTLSPYGVVARRGGSLADTIGFRDGRWTVQDESSMLVAQAAQPAPGMTVLDCCAAPGGKSTHLAELMRNEGRVIANDLHPHKRALVEQQAQRLGLSCIEAVTGDAAELGSRFAPSSFDIVLLDAPCSGLGVIARKPEIKWTKSEDDIAAIASIQHQLIDSVASLVKPGGRLVYSTCTIERDENEKQIERFLKQHADYELDTNWPDELLASLREAGAVGADFRGDVQLLPSHVGSDGFYIATLRRRA
ncbi:16S rRNA (cytosine967-C5)-methyltransferase [Paenibacillus cellulosilyticus]|uniref:16S rRNA (cytosine(967)-C(5))-methyltransferase n=1 Tax=Paenibacillus cellulosilyticus TaxID=375489 RepID=A0A2V2YX75_9BACL|nr:16S rRNA (cytosine(967)-C(5))-methyltransferase RsmB [Paenibacillus cellulosilyticus]PWW06214.1 16S rRNA (cytosine967-C5)-methyltransferase [Paenibacillus cellulosilyticus]QKS43024.1 16S rRNA (cytosine(967)-C(5))-methyltransferase RsmB [Paenibacillus cellulosilyticus]